MYEKGKLEFGPDDYVQKTSQLVFNTPEIEDYAGGVRKRIVDYSGIPIRPSLPTHLMVKSSFGLSEVKRRAFSDWLMDAAKIGRIAPITAKITRLVLSRESSMFYLVVSNPLLVRMRKHILRELEAMGSPCFGYEGEELRIVIADNLELDDSALRRAETFLEDYPHPRSFYISELVCYQKAAPDTPWCFRDRMPLTM